jgi:hypothetical protein
VALLGRRVRARDSETGHEISRGRVRCQANMMMHTTHNAQRATHTQHTQHCMNAFAATRRPSLQYLTLSRTVRACIYIYIYKRTYIYRIYISYIYRI